MTRPLVHNFSGRTALVLHRSEEIGQRIRSRCDRLGIRAILHAGDVDARQGHAADMLIVDIDTADDGQFPWPRGQAPVPIIGLIGSESPGRLAWSLDYGVDGYLPLSALGNLFSALVVAHECFSRRQGQLAREAERARQNAGRLDVIRAVLVLMKSAGDEALALKQLRTMAMVERLSLEDAACRFLAGRDAARESRS